MKTKSKTKLGKQAIGIATKSQPIPQSVLRRYLAEERSKDERELAERLKLQRAASRYTRKVSKPAAKTEIEKAEIARLARAFRKQALAHKIQFPDHLTDIGGLFSFSVNLVPPYSFSDLDTDFAGTGNTLAANINTGQLSFRFSADNGDHLLHFTATKLGSFFVPPQGAVSIRARANPVTSFSWWLNTPGPLVLTEGNISLRIVGFKNGVKHGESATGMRLWQEFADESNPGARFALGPANAVPLSTHLTLNGSDFYMIAVGASGIFGTAEASGLTSFSAGTLAMTIPSITLDVEMQPLLQA